MSRSNESIPRDDESGVFGFTIMEVMVAVMILAVSVVSIFGAQYAAVAATTYSMHTTHAIQLARCKMSEIELEIQIENGFEETDVEMSGDCCELLDGEDSIDEFECSWALEAVELPDMTEMMTGGPDGGGGFLDDFGLGDSEEGFGAAGMFSAYMPMLSEMLRGAIRRVTVKVEWKQGSRKKEFVLSQYLTHPTQGPLELMHGAMNAQEMGEEMGGSTGIPGMDGFRPSGGMSGSGSSTRPPK